MEIDETICPKCFKQYQQKNPPRLLIMCGHTFCEGCIKNLISFEVEKNQHYITCPIDSISTELQSPNVVMFPRNIAILNIVKKKKGIEKPTDRIMANKEVKSIELNRSSCELKENNLVSDYEKDCSQKEGEFDFQKIKIQNFGQDNNFLTQTCLLHQKPLDIICTKDYQKICASCVIFGQHRGHKVKSISQVDEMEMKMIECLEKMIFEQKQFFNKFGNDETFGVILQSLDSKKVELQAEIKKKYEQLIELIKINEKKSVIKLQRKIQQIKSKLEKNFEEKKYLKVNFGEWQDDINEKLIVLKNGSQQDKAEILFKSGNFVQNCEATVSKIKRIQSQFFLQTSQILSHISVVFEIQGLQSKIGQFCRIEEVKHALLPEHKVQDYEQGLLDDESSIVSLSKSMVVQKQLNTPLKSKKSREKERIRFDSVKSMNKSLNNSNVGRKPYKIFPCKNHSKNLSLNRTFDKVKKNVPIKFEKTVNNILARKSDVLDLTNGELGNEKVHEILEILKEEEISIVKIGRNKITDSGFQKLSPYLSHVSMLNLTKNQLTDESLFKIVKWRREGKLPKLKSLILGQNKIVQRKHRSTIDGLKFSGINICI